ncbi:MAG: potassium transporter TrkG [Bacteroidota bacterium]|jgi:trk system potassium uptake protein TrkH
MQLLYPSTEERRRALRHVQGTILYISAAIYLFMIPPGLAAGEAADTFLHFGIPGAVIFIIGLLLRRPGYVHVRLRMSDAARIVFWGWILLVLSAMPPFMTMAGMSPVQALFESVSGWTTTGLSVADIPHTHALIFLWRSVLQLAGGAGLAILLISISGGGSGSLYSRVEGRELLVPQVRASAQIVLQLYGVYLLAGVVAYMAVGMSFFEAFNHSCAAISTGGFSTRFDSIGAWDSMPVEAVTIALMILGNLNFLTAWLLVRRRWTALSRNSELRLGGMALGLAIILVYVSTTAHVYANFSKDLRVAVFETVSALTTTGFSTVSYGHWHPSGILILIILMIIGGGACSTAGGLKQVRVYILLQYLRKTIKKFVLPRGIVLPLIVHEGERPRSVSDNEMSAIAAFTFLYLVLLLSGTLLLTMYGYSVADSLFEFASALGTVGISVGVTSPHTPDVVLLAETAGMVLGRLEIFLVFAGLHSVLTPVLRILKRG